MNRYDGRHWIDKMKLSSAIAFMKRSYGFQMGNINIIWKVDRDSDHETNMVVSHASNVEGICF